MKDRLTLAYESFRAANDDAREMIEASPRFRERAEHRAQAYVSLVEASAMAYTHAVAPRPNTSRVHAQSSWHSTTFSLGQNGPDFRYGLALLDGRCTYRMRGRLGATKLFLVQIQSGVMGMSTAQNLCNVDLHDIAEPDGTFDISLSAEKRAGSWFEIDRDSRHNHIMMRRIFGTITDDPGEVEIERVEGPDAEPETEPDAVAERIEIAADLLRAIARNWMLGLYDLYLRLTDGQKNVMAHLLGEEIASMLGSPSSTYGFAVFDLAPEEAVILEWDPPETAYWSFQLGDVWSNALDFTNFQTDLNMISASTDSDGRFRAVVSAHDPGVPNWLDTRGRSEGSIAMRNYRARSECSAPTLRLVKLADVRSELPADTARISPAERAAALAQRRARYVQAYGD